MKKIWLLAGLLIVAVLVVSFTIMSGMNNATTSTSDTSTSGASDQSASITALSLSDVAKHSTQGDCWVTYQGKVYDLTAWLPIHPGGSGAISPYCGTQNFEQAFATKHGTTKIAKFMKVATYKGDFA